MFLQTEAHVDAAATADSRSASIRRWHEVMSHVRHVISASKGKRGRGGMKSTRVACVHCRRMVEVEVDTKEARCVPGRGCIDAAVAQYLTQNHV